MAQMAENSTFVRQLRTMARQGTTPHALILSGDADTVAARFVAAAMLCTAPDNRPCLQCAQCRKVLNDIHPDVLMVADDERKTLAVDAVRELRSELYIRPNDGERKIAIFPRVRQLNERDQNVLLKVVEEGPPYAAFIFCTENAGALLPTVRSRCIELRVPQQSGESAPNTAMLQAFTSAKACDITAYLVSLELSKLSREELQEQLWALWRTCVQALILCAGGAPGEELLQPGAELLCRSFGKEKLMALAELAKHYASELEYNVGVGHILGAIAAEWEKTK